MSLVPRNGLCLGSIPYDIQDTLWNGLVAYWNLNEVSGNRAAAVGGAGLALIDNNTVGSTTGVNSLGASFVAADSESLTCASSAILQIDGTTGISISIWLNVPSAATIPNILCKTDTGFTDFEWQIPVVGGLPGFYGLSLYVDGGDGSFTNYWEVDSFREAPLNEWVHWLFTFNPPDGSTAPHAYINSVSSEELNSPNGSPTTPHHGSAGLSLGSLGTLQKSTFAADELAIWNRVLTSRERTSLYNGGAGKFY